MTFPSTAWSIPSTASKMNNPIAHRLFEQSTTSALSSSAILDASDPPLDGTIQHNKKKEELFQASNQRGWTNMAFYWSIASVIGYFGKYFTKLIPQTAARLFNANSIFFGVPNAAFAVALAVTLFSRWRLDGRYSNYGRSVDWPAILLFAVCNGILETVMFVATYDLGKLAALKVFRRQSAVIAGGFFAFFNYSALIHVLFWLPRAFPQHTKKGSPSFLTHALPYLTFLSIAWIWLYESYNSIGAVCVLHTVLDLWAGRTMHLIGPWSKKG